MRRTIDEWRNQLAATVDNAKRNGMEWGMLTLLYEIALILLDILGASSITPSAEPEQRQARGKR